MYSQTALAANLSSRQGTAVGLPGAVRPYALLQGDLLHLYYEQYQLPLFRSSVVMVRKAALSYRGTVDVVFRCARPHCPMERPGRSSSPGHTA